MVSESADVTEGTLVADRWELHEMLARGSSGEVFAGTDRAERREVAVKVLLPEVIQDAVGVQRFLRECRTTGQLTHPHVVKVLGQGTHEGRPYLVMERLRGETLEARLGRGRLELDEVRSVVRQVGEALAAAHEAGVVHRDVKPDNLFVLEGGGTIDVKVLDFGYAKRNDALGGDGQLTGSNALLGTPLYMAPEQIRASRDVDARADLWSLAVIAYELLTGAAPFSAHAVADLFVQILTRPVPPLREALPSLPPSIDAWFARALDRDRAKRFQSAREFVATFERALDGREPPPPSPDARRSTLPARAASPTLPAWVYVLVAAAVAAVVALWALAPWRHR